MPEHSHQDDIYLIEEADAFFQRNFKDKPTPVLRDFKKTTLQCLDDAGVSFGKVLEFGCNYGDLLHYMKKERGTEVAYGVDASKEAIAFSRQRYGESIKIFHGTIASNDLCRDEKFHGFFDLVIVEDVFGWVSRETLFHSITNVDLMLKEGGHLYIRDYYPDRKLKNPNHHVKDGTVFSHKLPGSTSRIFEASGIYSPIYQKTYLDQTKMSSGYKSDYAFESMWADTVLSKSYSKFYENSKRMGK